MPDILKMIGVGGWAFPRRLEINSDGSIALEVAVANCPNLVRTARVEEVQTALEKKGIAGSFHTRDGESVFVYLDPPPEVTDLKSWITSILGREISDHEE